MAEIHVKTEADRVPAAIDFAKSKIEELNMEINACDYSEDVDGNPVYEPGCYSTEKHELEHEKRKWEIMMRILTDRTPFFMHDW